MKCFMCKSDNTEKTFTTAKLNLKNGGTLTLEGILSYYCNQILYPKNEGGFEVVLNLINTPNVIGVSFL